MRETLFLKGFKRFQRLQNPRIVGVGEVQWGGHMFHPCSSHQYSNLSTGSRLAPSIGVAQLSPQKSENAALHHLQYCSVLWSPSFLGLGQSERQVLGALKL